MIKIFFLFFLFNGVNAYAYLDPGTGSLLLYAIVGITTTVVFALRGFWYTLRSKLFLVKKSSVKELPDIVFHSEGGKYWQVFQPVLKALDKYGIKYGYITPDKNDPVFKSSLENAVPICPGKDLITLSYMNNIKTKIVVSTTPQLDVYMLKRSKKVQKYIHLFHAPADIGMYELYAFDYYDMLFCAGSFQKKSIRSVEKNRGEKAKELFEIGCPYYDYMLEEIGRLSCKKEKEFTVLYAPAWGERSSVVKYGTKVIDVLAEAGMRVLFRPHPQMYVSDLETIKKVEEKIKENSLIELDRNRTAAESMMRSDVMVSDISGIVFDYAFLFEKPVFLVNAEYDLGGYENVDVDGGYVWDVEKNCEITRIVKAEEIPELGSIIGKEYEKAERYKEKIREIKEKEIYNFGKAGEAAAKELVEILAKVK